MGIVYLALDTRLDRQVALKVVAPDLVHDEEFQERFEAEARSAAAIEHPNAVPIYSAGSADGHLYIAMRYVAGTDLRHHLAESGPLAPAAAAAVVSEVGAALDAAHAAGFVHRDVKPANILLDGRPGAGTAYLTDFGLTRGLGAGQAQLTRTGQWIGTLDYVAPEQVAAGRVDARTDIYSLGCVFYEMLSGSVPYGGDEMQKLWAKANKKPPSLPGGGNRSFDPVLARSLAREPEDRFRSAGDLGRAAAAAAGAGTARPTERSVATGAAAAGLLEGDAAGRGHRPAPADPYERRTTQMPAAAPRKRRAPVGSVAIVLAAMALAGGLVAGALVLAGKRGSDTATVVRKTEAAAASGKRGGSAGGEEPEPAAETETEAETETQVGREGEEASAAAVAGGGGREPFYGGLYTATVPAGWVQEEEEATASDGSYVENTWNSPAEDESLKVDESPGGAKDPTESAEMIAEDLESAGEPVYAVKEDVVRGGVLGSEVQFHSTAGLPERADFFFNLGNDGFAVLGSAYDLRTAKSLVGPLVGSLEPSG